MVCASSDHDIEFSHNYIWRVSAGRQYSPAGIITSYRRRIYVGLLRYPYVDGWLYVKVEPTSTLRRWNDVREWRRPTTSYRRLSNVAELLHTSNLSGTAPPRGLGAGAPHDFNEPPIGTWIFENYHALCTLFLNLENHRMLSQSERRGPKKNSCFAHWQHCDSNGPQHFCPGTISESVDQLVMRSKKKDQYQQ